MSAEILDLLPQLDFFSAYPKKSLEIISKYLTRSTMNKNAVIFSEGDAGNFMLFIVDGQVAVYKNSENGAKPLLTYASKGLAVGEMALIEGSARSATCIAERRCDILVMTDEAFQSLASDDPTVAFQFAMGLATLISRRLRHASGELADFVIAAHMSH
ncbi:cyclic nucleotide-binding domain-containing protein [Denitratisoma sp. agr-D3]